MKVLFTLSRQIKLCERYMKDNIADGVYVASSGIIIWLGINSLNDALTAISVTITILVGVGRVALIIKKWREK